MPDFSNSTNSNKVQEGLVNLQKACMGLDGDFTDVDEVLITQYIFAGYSHRYVDVRRADEWMFTTNQRIRRSELMWLKELKKDAYQPGIGSWVTAQVHLFPAASGSIQVFDEEVQPPTETSGRKGTAEVISSELLAFPRTLENIPSWMRSILEAAHMSPPLYNREQGTVDWNNKRLPVTDYGTDFSKDPAVIDSSDETGVFAKISKKLFGA